MALVFAGVCSHAPGIVGRAEQAEPAARKRLYDAFDDLRLQLEASKPDGDRKGGVVWHTQGAGKSIEMACLAGKLLTDKRLQNPTLVMVTDRQDLDGQLFGVFSGSGDLLG